MAQLGFDASQVAPDQGQLDPVPSGWYVAQITKSEIVPTKGGDGARLAVTVDILEPSWAKGRKIFEGFNIRNANPVAQEIAYKQLSALCHAVGILQVQDSEQLHNRPFKVKVKLVPAVKEADGTEKYAPKNEVSAWKTMQEDVQLAVSPNAVASGPAGAVVVPPQAGYQAGGFTPPSHQQQMPQGAMMATPGQYQQPAYQQPAYQQPQQQMQPQQAQPQQMQPQQPWPQPGQQQPQQMQQPAQQLPIQQPIQQQAPVEQQMQQQPQQMQQPAQDPAQVAGAATPPWQRQGA